MGEVISLYSYSNLKVSLIIWGHNDALSSTEAFVSCVSKTVSFIEKPFWQNQIIFCTITACFWQGSWLLELAANYWEFSHFYILNLLLFHPAFRIENSPHQKSFHGTSETWTQCTFNNSYTFESFVQIPRAKAASLLYSILNYIIPLDKFYGTKRWSLCDSKVLYQLRTTNSVPTSGEQVKWWKTIQGNKKHKNCFIWLK